MNVALVSINENICKYNTVPIEIHVIFHIQALYHPGYFRISIKLFEKESNKLSSLCLESEGMLRAYMTNPITEIFYFKTGTK